MDYLTSDVVDLLTPVVHDFVLRASILGRMNASLCDAVVGTSGSGAILANLERSNLFTSVDSTGEWYQLHHLFAEALVWSWRAPAPSWCANCISGPLGGSRTTATWRRRPLTRSPRTTLRWQPGS